MELGYTQIGICEIREVPLTALFGTNTTNAKHTRSHEI